MPLTAIEAVAVDIETTGLDTRNARIVQLAGVAITLGRPRAEETFATLVDPGGPIPTSSTAIHGIGDEAVRGAPRLAEALNLFQEFLGGRLLVGHSIGFDLAVLEHEAGRAGIRWEKPRSLCVRLLGTSPIRICRKNRSKRWRPGWASRSATATLLPATRSRQPRFSQPWCRI